MKTPRTHLGETDARFDRRSEPGSYALLLTLSVAMFTLGMIYYAERLVLPNNQIYFIMTLLPVLLTAFFYGLVPGLIAASFYSLVFLPHLIFDIQAVGLSTSTIQFIAYFSFLHILAYFVADLVNSMRTQTALSTAVRDWDALLSRASNLDEVIVFILEQSKKICSAQDAVFLLRNPMDAQWEAITLQERSHLTPSRNDNAKELTLAEWILHQDSSVILNGLHQDSSFLVHPPESLRSFLARPFIHQDGRRMGWLVLLNKGQGSFSNDDLQLLDDLIAAGIKTLEHAGLFARTDYALARQVERLAAIQRMARELNMMLDPNRILERTLECAIEITGSEVGFIGIDIEGLPQISLFSGIEKQVPSTKRLILDAIRLERSSDQSPTVPIMPGLLPNAQSRLRALIRGGGESMGIIIVESSRPRVFEDSADYVLSILADHAAIALENARLFDEIQNEKQRMGLILHSVADGLLTTDRAGSILTMNPAAESLTGWKTEESIGRHFCEVFGLMSDEGGKHECMLEQAIDEGKVLYEDRRTIRKLLGSQQVIALSIAPLSDKEGQPSGAVVLFRDITRQDEMDKLQRELIASISHELRTPLANIRSVAEMLSSEDFPTSDEASEYLDILGAQSQRLAGFLDKVIDVHRLETGQLNLQIRPLPIALLVESVVRQWQITVPEYQIQMNVPSGLPMVWGDENALHSILNNLLDNAIKYSRPGSQIDVFAKTASSGEVIVSVSDQGPGVPPEYQSRIFERFFRVNGGDAQSVYGHGLGLYITRNLVEEMNGKIWVQSDNNTGSTFSFALPIMEAHNE